MRLKAKSTIKNDEHRTCFESVTQKNTHCQFHAEALKKTKKALSFHEFLTCYFRLRYGLHWSPLQSYVFDKSAFLLQESLLFQPVWPAP